MNRFTITDDIKNLNINKIKENLLKYSYDGRKLKNYFTKPSEELEHLYSSFKGEVYENIIYELLLDYALNNEEITKFILKGPHQKRDKNQNKSGLLIDNSNQIVYKASYKDISEFDALFFTENELFFVEMSTSKKTASLNKRLFKKYALLKVLFPYLEIKALIVVTKGSVGLNNFPEYCTVWVTNDLDNDTFLKELVSNRVVKKEQLNTYSLHEKLIEAYELNHSNFKYFQTLKWILLQARSNNRFSVDLAFFNSKNLDLYFDIYTKLYIGFISYDEFKTLVPTFESSVRDDKVIVTIEKINQKKFALVYYPKESKGQLKRVLVDKEKGINIKNKESEGFTNAEVKFMLNVLVDKFKLTLADIEHINNNITIIKPR